MSDESNAEAQSGEAGTNQDQAAAQGQPQLLISAQYIKDFSFENPNAPAMLFQLKEAPSINVDIDTTGRSLGRDYYEVDLKISATATYQEKTAFVTELVYSGVVHVQNVTEQQKSAFILVEGPRQLFPFARQIVAQATTQSGFPPLMLNPVDFVALLRRKQQQQQDEGQGTSAAGGNGQDADQAATENQG